MIGKFESAWEDLECSAIKGTILMDFRGYISGFRYRQKMDEQLRRYQEIKPPSNPSREYVDRLINKLLDEQTMRDALKELFMMGVAAVRSALAALDDTRFHQFEWPEVFAGPRTR